MNEPARADGHDFVRGEQTFKALKLRLIVPTRKIADFIFSPVRELFCAGNEVRAHCETYACMQSVVAKRTHISLVCFPKILLGADYGK